MVITPYKQTLTHSCLAACMLMLHGKNFMRSDEQDLAIKGSQRIYPFYVVGIPTEFVKKSDIEVSVFVDNTFFTSVLNKAFSRERRIHVMHQQITTSVIKELLQKKSLICHIDGHALGDYSHTSHFILLEKATEQFVYVIDPWTGLRRKIRFSTLEKAINELKNHVKMCPLLFSFES